MSGLVLRDLGLHGAVLALVFAAGWLFGGYVELELTRIALLAVYALGYNLLYGYAGLLSLGHALLFAAGLYGAALGVTQGHLAAPAALALGLAAALAASAVIGAIVLRTSGVAFMIVTLMFAQAGFLAVLYFGSVTRGDEGIVLPEPSRQFDLLGRRIDLTDPDTRFLLAFAALVAASLISLAVARSRRGRILVAIRENEARTRMLGYDTRRRLFEAFVLSGTLAGLAGALHALLFAYAGASLASVQNSVDPLLYTLLGGAGTVLGPLVGTGIMYALVSVLGSASHLSLLVVGLALLALVLFFPRGIVGALRARVLPWLP